MRYIINGDLTEGLTKINNVKRGDVICNKGVFYIFEDEKTYVPLDYETKYSGVVPKTFTLDEFPQYNKWADISRYVWFIPSSLRYDVRDTKDRNIFRVEAITKDNFEYVFYFNFDDKEYEEAKELMNNFVTNPPCTPILACLDKSPLINDMDECVPQMFDDESNLKQVLYVRFND